MGLLPQLLQFWNYTIPSILRKLLTLFPKTVSADYKMKQNEMKGNQTQQKHVSRNMVNHPNKQIMDTVQSRLRNSVVLSIFIFLFCQSQSDNFVLC